MEERHHSGQIMTAVSDCHTQQTQAKKERRRFGWRWLRRLVLAATVLWLIQFVLHQVLPRHFKGIGEPLAIDLPHGVYQVLYFCSGELPKGIVIFATGDGGWSAWEEKVAGDLATRGYAVGGWDCRKFADSRKYDQSELSAGFMAAVNQVRLKSGAAHDCPVFYGGWSTGAEQSVAAAAMQRPEAFSGLLLVAPGRHGRYGITESDLLGIEPSGPGSFALSSMAQSLAHVPVTQFVAGLDPLDDTSWLEALHHSPKNIVKMPNCLHDMGGAGDEFLKRLGEAIEWSLVKRRSAE